MSLIPNVHGFSRVVHEMNREMERYGRRRGYSRVFDEMSREKERFDRRFMPPYWLNSDDSLAVGNTATEVVNDKKKFSVALDVSHFKPEELKLNLDGSILRIEGEHEIKDQHSVMKRSFSRVYTLPKDVNLEAVSTKLDDKGHLAIVAPKKDQPIATVRNIPIEHHK